MYRRVTSKVRGQILALSAQKLSSFMIRKELLKSSDDVLERKLRRIVEKASQSTAKKQARGRRRKKWKPAEIKMSTLIKKVDQNTESDNPMAQREMARQAKVSSPDVYRIIRKTLDKKAHEKEDRLTPQRRHNCQAKTTSQSIFGISFW